VYLSHGHPHFKKTDHLKNLFKSINFDSEIWICFLDVIVEELVFVCWIGRQTCCRLDFVGDGNFNVIVDVATLVFTCWFFCRNHNFD